MEIYVHSDDFIKMFALGIETAYKGKSITFDDNTKTLVYYYYTNFSRLYVIDGKDGNTELPNIIEKVRIIAKFEDNKLKLFQKHLKSIIRNKKILYMPDEFFLDVMIELRSKKPLFSNIVAIYNKYTNKDNYLKNGNELIEWLKHHEFK